MLDRELADIAEQLLATDRQQRNEDLFALLKRNEHEAAGRGTLGAGFYKRQQMNACVDELRERARRIRATYERVIADARVPWTDSIRDHIVARITAELSENAGYIEARARDVIVQHGHGFETFLVNEVPRMLAEATAELALFGRRQTQIPTRLSVLLADDRYAAPRTHWIAAQAHRHAVPPDLMSAARESVNTIEGIARILTASHTSTLGDCIKQLRNAGRLHPSILKQLEGLWGASSNIQGLRHGAAVTAESMDEQLLFIADAAEAFGLLLVRLDQGAT